MIRIIHFINFLLLLNFSHADEFEWIKVPAAPLVTAIEIYRGEEPKHAIEENKEEMFIYFAVTAEGLLLKYIATDDERLDRFSQKKYSEVPPKNILIFSLESESSSRRTLEYLRNRYPDANITAVFGNETNPESGERLSSLKGLSEKILSGEAERFDIIHIDAHGAPFSKLVIDQEVDIRKTSILDDRYLRWISELDLARKGASLRVGSCGSAGGLPIVGEGGTLYLNKVGNAFLRNGGHVVGSTVSFYNGSNPNKGVLLRVPLEALRELKTLLSQKKYIKFSTKIVRWIPTVLATGIIETAYQNLFGAGIFFNYRPFSRYNHFKILPLSKRKSPRSTRTCVRSIIAFLTGF